MIAIELNDLTKRWGDTIAVDRVSFKVEEGTFTVLLGPSGCGKSTSLRMIAGLDDASEGKIAIGGTDMTCKTSSERRLSMVFQSYALFPHLNTAENILFGLKVRKVSAEEQAKRLKKVADLVGLSDLLDRKPAQLSGGQRQRVALARAIIAENPICLMDEPLSNLDAKLRHDMRIEIRALQQRLNMTVVYVTHDQAEAMSMADKVILMRNGQVEQEGTPDELYNKPETKFAASFIGTPPMSLLETRNSEKGCVITGENLTPVLDGSPNNTTIGIRPEHISISHEQGVLTELISADYLGADTIVSARIDNQKILIRRPGRFNVTKPVSARLNWHKKDVHIFDAVSNRRDDNIKALNV